MVDNHVHVGWYLDGYHSPREVWNEIEKSCVDEICVSSTSTCAELYKQIVREMKELKKYGGRKVHPILWLTPKMLRYWGLRYMLRSKVEWHGVKIHPEAHRNWASDRKLARKAAEVARRLGVPFLIHTGANPASEASGFRFLIEENPDITFVLAHGRPTDQCIEILGRYDNVWIDTAFMPVERLQLFLDAGFSDRVLFGTDAPVNKVHNPGINTHDYIAMCVDELKSVTDDETFAAMARRSPYRL